MNTYFVSQQYDVAKIINEKGCVQAGEEWMERNLLIIAGVAVATAFLQVCKHFNMKIMIFKTIQNLLYVKKKKRK